MTRDEYEAKLCARINEARPIPFREVQIGEWRPEIAKCHENVDRWVSHHPGHTAVRGWIEYLRSGDETWYTAHSIVRGINGAMFDITPTFDPDCWRGKFIIHLGDEQTFFVTKEKSHEIRCVQDRPAPKLEFWVVSAAEYPSSDADESL